MVYYKLKILEIYLIADLRGKNSFKYNDFQKSHIEFVLNYLTTYLKKHSSENLIKGQMLIQLNNEIDRLQYYVYYYKIINKYKEKFTTSQENNITLFQEALLKNNIDKKYILELCLLFKKDFNIKFINEEPTCFLAKELSFNHWFLCTFGHLFSYETKDECPIFKNSNLVFEKTEKFQFGTFITSDEELIYEEYGQKFQNFTLLLVETVPRWLKDFYDTKIFF